MNPSDKMASARLMSCKRMPYFRAAIMGLVFKEVVGRGASLGIAPTFFMTKHGVLLWEREALDRWNVEETAAVLIHEVMHLLRGHAERCERVKPRDRMLWNVAIDMEINDDLHKAKLPLPDGGGKHPKSLNLKENLLGEEYYRELEKLPKKQSEQGNGAQNGGKNGAKDDSEGKGKGEGQDGDNEVAQAPTSQGVGNGRCGGCAGNPEEGEEELTEGAGRSEVEIERIKRTVAEDIRRTAEQARGSVPGGWERWANQQLKPPQIPWRQKLARAVRGAIAYRPGAVDYHYTRPSRRQAGIGFGAGRPILPALRAPVPRVSVIVDTSGSMGDKELMEAVSEIQGILDATGANATLCACDAKVQDIRRVHHWRDVVKLLTGGGGTDFRPPIEAMAREKPRPDTVVFITDGQGPAPATPPPFKMVWVLVGAHRCKPHAGKYGGNPVTYGEFVEILRDNEEAKVVL